GSQFLLNRFNKAIPASLAKNAVWAVLPAPVLVFFHTVNIPSSFMQQLSNEFNSVLLSLFVLLSATQRITYFHTDGLTVSSAVLPIPAMPAVAVKRQALDYFFIIHSKVIGYLIIVPNHICYFVFSTCIVSSVMDRDILCCHFIW